MKNKDCKIDSDIDDDRRHNLLVLNESGCINGKIIKWSKELFLQQDIKNILLAGETNAVKQTAIECFKNDSVYTTGLDDVDLLWNFENNCIIDIKFDLIISQAVLEHLVNPYKHMQDLAGLLTDNGFIIVYTVTPGFKYHKCPIDTLRFYPDWFEVIAPKLGLMVYKNGNHKHHIFYMLCKRQGKNN